MSVRLLRTIFMRLLPFALKIHNGTVVLLVFIFNQLVGGTFIDTRIWIWFGINDDLVQIVGQIWYNE